MRTPSDPAPRPGPSLPDRRVPHSSLPGGRVPDPSLPGPSVPGPSLPGPSLPGPSVPGLDPGGLDLAAVDQAIDDLAEDAFGFLERLVAAPSTVGCEAAAQQVVRYELDRLGFTTSAIPIAEDIATDEAVELDSIVAGARTLARFLAAYYAGGGLPAPEDAP